MNLDNKRILVTGGNGFLGKHVVEELKCNGAGVISAPLSVHYNLIKENDILEMLYESKPDIVIHLAASVGGIGANQKNPGKFFYDNAIMGIQLMEQARINNVEKFVTIGTVCCYPKYTRLPFKEKDLWNGYPEETNAAYGLAKKMLLVQGQAYKKQYDFNSIFLIPVNLYGLGDNFDLDTSHVIPAIIKKVHHAIHNKEGSITIWGDGTATREFIYVKDAAEAIIMATKGYDKGDPVNIGTGDDISIKELVLIISDIMGFEGFINWDHTKPNGQPKRKLDVTRAKEEFNFEATTTLINGLKETIDWYQGNKDLWN